jgi:hypothetical protein
MGAALVSLAIGPAAFRLWPWSGGFVLLVLGVAGVLLVRSVRSDSVERHRGVGIVAAVVGNLGVVLAVGFGRSFLGWENGFALRYVTLTLPLIVGAYVGACSSWNTPRGRTGAGVVCASLALSSIVALPLNAVIGTQYGASVRKPAELLERMVLGGAPPGELVRFYASRFQDQSGQPDLERSRGVLRALCARRRPPFDRSTARDPAEFDE